MIERPSLTRNLLDRYFGCVKPLHTYLSGILEPEDGNGYLPTDDDSPTYRELLNTSYVAIKDAESNFDQLGKRRLRAVPPMMYMRDVIDRAQETLFRKTNGRASSIITAGYRLASRNGDPGKKGTNRIGLTNFFVNTMITALNAPEWESLLQRAGADAMIHLLTETHVFVSLPNECLCQMTGEPIIHIIPHPPNNLAPAIDSITTAEKTQAIMKRKAPGAIEDIRPRKHPKLCDSAQSRTTSSGSLNAKGALPIKVSPADVALVRARLFYARPSRVPQSNRILFGLPKNHVLNILHPCYQKVKEDPAEYVDPDPRKLGECARLLAKYVFARQFNLSNPFTVPQSQRREAFKFPDYSDRETEIKNKGPVKTPKRLKDILPLIEKLVWMHTKCGYKPLRDHACPSKLKNPDIGNLDSSVILEMMSEYSERSQIYSQIPDVNASVDSNGFPVTPRGFSQAQRDAKNKPQFAKFACSHSKVYCYAVLVTKAVIPKAFWGCDKNFKLISQHIKSFVSCRRYETITLHQILQGFSTAECDWLIPPGGGAKQQTRVSVSDSLKRRELLEDFLFWYFDSFLLPLLRTTFYVTESSAFRNQVLYFRHDDWQALCAPLIERLTSNTFEKIPAAEAEELLRQRKLGFSFVRLLPKDTGVRPIVNLRRRSARRNAFTAGEQSINQILQAAFQVLSYEKRSRPELLGASVFGANEVYSRLKAFKLRLPRGPKGKLLPLYFVKVDVQACFDTIEQAELLRILHTLISEDVFMIQRYGQVCPVGRKVRRTYVKKAMPEDEHPHFLAYATDLANVLRSMIFVDQVVYSYAKKQEILQLLEEHITENLVKIGQNYYRQFVGIPQGSVLSALLCCFFYGDMEKSFSEYTQDPQSLMLRWIDDYLYVTTSLSKARGFLDMMNKGHPKYGCFISKEKTLTNFDYDAQIMNVTEGHQKYFPWCGYLIDMKDLSVTADYSRYQGTSLHDSLTVDRGRRPGAAFAHKMLQLAKAKSHLIYCDTNLNTETVVYLNIYQNFALSAMKFHGYIKTWGIDTRHDRKYIHNIVRQMIQYTVKEIRNKASTHVARENAGKVDIQKSSVIWLGVHAFHAVLSRKRQYSALSSSLKFELSLAKNRRLGKRFRRLVMEGFAGISHIEY